MSHKPEHHIGEVNEATLRQAATAMGARVLTRVVGWYGILSGVSILVGGKDRFSSEMSGYQIAIQLPGAPQSWGIWLLVAGALILGSIFTGSSTGVKIGLMLSGIWSVALSISFARAASVYPEAAVTGMWAYGKDAVMYFVMAVAFHSRYYRKYSP